MANLPNFVKNLMLSPTEVARAKWGRRKTMANVSNQIVIELNLMVHKLKIKLKIRIYQQKLKLIQHIRGEGKLCGFRLLIIPGNRV